MADIDSIKLFSELRDCHARVIEIQKALMRTDLAPSVAALLGLNKKKKKMMMIKKKSPKNKKKDSKSKVSNGRVTKPGQ